MKRWQEEPLGGLIYAIEAGVSLAAEDRPARAGERGVLKVSAISSGVFRPGENKVIPIRSYDRAGPSPRKGDLIVARASGSPDLVGAVAFVDQNYPNLSLSDKLWRLEAGDDVGFVRYALSSRPVRRKLLNRSSGSSGMRNISQRNLLSLRIPTPPVDIRRRIGAILDAFDRRLTLVSRLIDEKFLYRRGVAHEILTGQRRFFDFENEDWQDVRLGDVFIERDESARPELPLLAITGDQGVVFRDQLSRRDSSAADKSKYKRILPGDIGYNTMRMWQGVSALSTLEGIVSPAYTIVVPNSEMDARFIAQLFKLPVVIDRFRRHSQGLVDDTLNLKYPQFAKVRVMLPSIKEQSRISDLLDAVDLEIKQLTSLKTEFENQKDALLEGLLSRTLTL